MTEMKRRYPRADAGKQPTDWWYYGRAIYVSRFDYRKIFYGFLALGIPFAAAGLLFHLDSLWRAAWITAGLGFLLLGYSLFGLYRQYGPPARRYFQRLVDGAGLGGAVKVADIHIGTYRHAYKLAEVLPDATIFSVDCWQEGFSSEIAIADVRALEPAPNHEPRLIPLKAGDFQIPLETGSCDAIVFGFGTHEIPAGAERARIFAEAMRVLKPGGKALLFEHGIDFQNYLIFGPVIDHVTPYKEWLDVLRPLLKGVHEDRLYAVNMITGVKA